MYEGMEAIGSIMNASRNP